MTEEIKAVPGRLLRLRVQPGDVILVEYDPRTQRVSEVAETLINMGVRIPKTCLLFVPKGTDLSVLTDEQLEANGLMRRPDTFR